MIFIFSFMFFVLLEILIHFMKKSFLKKVLLELWNDDDKLNIDGIVVRQLGWNINIYANEILCFEFNIINPIVRYSFIGPILQFNAKAIFKNTLTNEIIREREITVIENYKKKLVAKNFNDHLYMYPNNYLQLQIPQMLLSGIKEWKHKWIQAFEQEKVYYDTSNLEIVFEKLTDTWKNPSLYLISTNKQERNLGQLIYQRSENDS